jgi:hypothetical protein
MFFSMAKHELRKSEAAGPNKKKTPDNVLLPDVFRRGEKRFISS